MPTVHLLFGSNLGNRVTNIHQAILSFVEEGFTLLQVSNFYETEPWGKKSQPSFLNICVKFSTDLLPHDLLLMCKQIEYKIGRQNRGKWQEREIDVDILYYGKKVIKRQELVIPHQRLIQRKFALAPLAELSPNKQHPILKLNSKELLKLCTDKQAVLRLPIKPKV